MSPNSDFPGFRPACDPPLKAGFVFLVSTLLSQTWLYDSRSGGQSSGSPPRPPRTPRRLDLGHFGRPWRSQSQSLSLLLPLADLLLELSNHLLECAPLPFGLLLFHL